MFDIFIATNEDEKWHIPLIDSYPHANIIAPGKNITESIAAARLLSNTEMFWVITDDWRMVNEYDIDFAWKPNVHDRHYVHKFVATINGHKWDGFRGLYLIPRRYQLSSSEIALDHIDQCKILQDFAIDVSMFDIFFISYDESFANSNFHAIKSRWPRVRRVHGIKGIANAHKRCAELSVTNYFWTIDADTVIADRFNFDYLPSEFDTRYLHVWYSQNPVNDTTYGWGAVKLWPRRDVLGFDGSWLDYTTTVGKLKIVDDIAATSNFNVDALSSWRSGFREAVKLCQNVAGNGDDADSLNRLHAWVNKANAVPFSTDAVLGARAGVIYYSKSDRDELSLINDFDWLAVQFANRNLDMDANIDKLFQDKQTLLDVVLGMCDV